jgi:hypothetical protein
MGRTLPTEPREQHCPRCGGEVDCFPNHKCSLPDVSLKDFHRLEGSVAQCECGLTWVLGTSPVTGMYPWWNAEGWFARWRRERHQRKEAARKRRYLEERSGIVVLPTVNANPDVLPPSAAVAPRGQGSDPGHRLGDPE